MQNTRVKPSAYEVFQRITSDLDRYQAIIDYFNRNTGCRKSGENRSYLTEILDELSRLEVTFRKNDELGPRISSMYKKLHSTLRFDKACPTISTYEDALKPIFKRKIDFKNDFIRLSELRAAIYSAQGDTQ